MPLTHEAKILARKGIFARPAIGSASVDAGDEVPKSWLQDFYAYYNICSINMQTFV